MHNNSSTDPSMSTEILAFMHQVFPNCKSSAQYYHEERAWNFLMSFTTDNTRSYTINPPRGICLMKVHQVGREVMFSMTLFVRDFQAMYASKVQMN